MDINTQKARVLHYVYALLAVALTVAIRFLVLHWAGGGAPYNFFFITILIVTFFWGAGPGFFSGVLSAAIAGLLYVFHGGYSESQAISQSVLFLVETGIVGQMATRVRNASLKEHEANAHLSSSNELLQKSINEIRRTQRFLQAFLDYSPSVIFIRDLNGRYILANRKAAQLLAMSEAELKGKTNFDFFPKETAEALKAFDHAVFNAKTALTNEETIDFEDQTRTFIGTRFPLLDAQGEISGICGILTDITERKKAAEAERGYLKRLEETQHAIFNILDDFGAEKIRLEATQKALLNILDDFNTEKSKAEKARGLLQSFLDFSPSTIFIKDRNGRFVLVNRRAAEQVGITPAQMTGKTNFDIFPRPVAEELQAKDEAVFRTGTALTYEETFDFKDGRRYFISTQFPYFDEKGVLLGLCGILSDITERKRTEEELRKREAELREAQRVAHMGSWVRDAKGNVLIWSEELYRIFGWDLNIQPPSFSDLPRVYTAETMAKLRPLIDRLLKEGVPYQVELELLRPDGSHRWISSTAEPVRNSSGLIVGFRGTSQDITELKQLQRIREEWTSVIAHDLRQPISVISMSASVLLRTSSEEIGEKRKRALDRIQSAASSLSRMVEDLLDISLMESQRLKLRQSWIDPKVFTQEVLERLSHVTDGYRVSVSEEGELLPVFADPTRVEQILGNLISNAAKYGKKGTEIRIELKAQRDQMVQFSVSNEGQGIPQEELPHLFRRFSRSELTRQSKVPGLGLGLYITKGLVEAHGGRIWVESVPGKTTTFYFTLPTHVATTRSAAA